MAALLQVLQNHGRFCQLYTDRGSHYFTTPKAGGKVDKQQLTQVGRALQIPTKSPADSEMMSPGVPK